MAFKSCALLAALVALLGITQTSGLQCYSCKNEVQNSGSCDSFVVTCGDGEDSCVTKLHSEKVEKSASSSKLNSARALLSPSYKYFVSKGCARSELCGEMQTASREACTQLWYKDSSCFSCCTEDGCNRDIDLNVLSATKA